MIAFQIEQRYLTCSIMHILYKYQLDGKKYTESSSDSLQTLINNLYNDPKILEYFDDLNSPRPGNFHLYWRVFTGVIQSKLGFNIQSKKGINI